MSWYKALLDFFSARGDLEDTFVYHFTSYSQEGEDMVLRRIFDGKKEGFYVDVGAHHPQRYSNTYYFYLQGWRGINIDAMPGCMERFNKLRPEDINIEAAIAKEKRERAYFMFNEMALNSFDEDLSQSRNNEAYHIIGKKIISTVTLADVLNKHLPYEKKIDFLSIDVEGLDLEVLESNDWNKYRPECVLVECFGRGLDDIENNDVYKFLLGKDYVLFAKTVNTYIFITLP